MKARNSHPEPSQGSDWLLWQASCPKTRTLETIIRAFHADMITGRQPRWLTLAGKSQRGKTHCAKALWREVRSKCQWNPSWADYPPRFVYWPDFVDKLRDGESFGLFNDMKRWPFLFLDDIGAERDPNGFAIEKLNTLLGCRSGRWTVLTTNMGAAEWAKTEFRIASRMSRDGSQLLELDFPAYVQH